MNEVSASTTNFPILKIIKNIRCSSLSYFVNPTIYHFTLADLYLLLHKNCYVGKFELNFNIGKIQRQQFFRLFNFGGTNKTAASLLIQLITRTWLKGHIVCIRPLYVLSYGHGVLSYWNCFFITRQAISFYLTHLCK